MLSSKNKSISNGGHEEDSSFNAVGNQASQIDNNNNNNNQPPQYIKQFREIINIDKLNNHNKIKFSSPNEINNKNRLKDNLNSKGKIKSIRTGNIFQSGKIMNKIEKDKSEINNKEISQESSISYSNRTNSQNIFLNKNNININNNENYSSNINNNNNNNQNNYYYYKKEAILKKQQQQKSFLSKKEKENINNVNNVNNVNNDINSNIIIQNRIKNNVEYNHISKSKTTNDLNFDNINEGIKKNTIPYEKETIKENENYLSDDNNDNSNNSNDKEINEQISSNIFVPSPLRSGNQSTKNIKEFTLEKIPTQKLNNSFTLEQSKEHVKMFIESNNILDEKPNSEVILENIKLQKLKDDTIKKIKKNESEMKSISYSVYQHVINIYKGIDSDNKDISALTDSLQKYMRQNLVIKDDKESEQLYKNFKKSFFNYILCEVELNNVEKQIEKRKIGGKWELSQDDNNSLKNKFKLNTIRDDFDKAYGKPKNIYKK